MTQDATILVIEDNPDVRRTVVRQLVELGYRTIEAADGAAAWEVLRSNAREALRLRPGLRMLFTSGFPDGAVDCDEQRHSILVKPCRKQDLARSIRNALRRSSS